ncbi:ABC transporter ATP-binding protein [Paradevosia shaoguanensis]|uniref:ABC transporter ATP-binding protein n=1 Tax=Paradevosia shaoguanensis TaxID=1335043 RepID=UPI003C788C15
MGKLLEVTDLKVDFATAKGTLRAVDGVSFSLDKGESLGLVGESGCGKSTTAYALMRLLSDNGRVSGGKVEVDGKDLVAASDVELRKSRWQDIAIVFQNAMTALNPVMKIGDQLADALVLHQQVPRSQAMARAAEIFEKVGLAPSRLMHYPHEFSGGMKQRAVMALALICSPKVLLADEPTTALDVVAQRQVLELLVALKKDFGLSLILISHDISAVAETCERVAVMYAGQIVEEGPTRRTLLGARHPYTRGLVASMPSLHADIDTLESIEGGPPDLTHPPAACRFAPRCPYAQPICTAEAPPMVEVDAERRSRCHFALDLDQLKPRERSANVAS